MVNKLASTESFEFSKLCFFSSSPTRPLFLLTITILILPLNNGYPSFDLQLLSYLLGKAYKSSLFQ